MINYEKWSSLIIIFDHYMKIFKEVTDELRQPNLTITERTEKITIKQNCSRLLNNINEEIVKMENEVL